MFQSFDPGTFVKGIFASLGLSAALVSWLSTLVLVIMTGLIAWISNLLSKAIILRIVTSWVKRSKTAYDDMFLETKMFHRLSWIVPGVVVWYLASWLLKDNLFWLVFVHKSAGIYVVIIAILSVNAFIEAWYRIYLTLPVAEGRSIKGYVQMVKAIMVITGILIMISILFRISITNIIAGLGVASAALLIVFKDTLLGLVASMQLSTNRMLRLGDWITIPGRNIDGTVIDMSLHTVKVRNFDNTILTVPTYALVSDSFQNWKGMEDAGVRRIKRDIRVDIRSISFLTLETYEVLKKRPFMEPWLSENEEQIELLKKGEACTLTNIGAFRAYMLEYLRNHKYVDNELPIMVRDMPASETGLPVELYCFSKINQWVPYEAIQSGIFDYVYAAIGQFGLRPFQNITGGDIEILKK